MSELRPEDDLSEKVEISGNLLDEVALNLLALSHYFDSPLSKVLEVVIQEKFDVLAAEFPELQDSRAKAVKRLAEMKEED